VDFHDLAAPGGAAHREQGEVREMAGPGFVAVVLLTLVCVPLWALIWGRKERPNP
jgi:hypothetical protein